MRIILVFFGLMMATAIISATWLDTQHHTATHGAAHD